jgi:hypothetical protein
MDVVRGTIGVKPWGWTLGGLGAAQRTAEVVLRAADEKEYRIRFDRGVVVAASSPLVVDSIARLALTNQFIAAVQVNEIKRCLAAAPELDEIEVLAAAAHFDPETTQKLRLRALTQRAARTFTVDAGEFTIEECEPLPSAGARVAVQAVVFLGARMNLSEDRLRFGLRQFGSRFVLKPKASTVILSRFQFTPKERTLVDALRSPTSLAELEASHREIDPRGIQAVVYALASCSALAELDLTLDEHEIDFEEDIEVLVPSSRDSDLAIPIEEELTRPIPEDLVLPLLESLRAGSPASGAFDEPALAQGTPGARAPSLLELEIEEEPDAGESFDGPLTKAIASLDLDEIFHTHPEILDETVTVTRDVVPKSTRANTAKTVRIANDRAMLDTFKTGKVTLVRPNALKAQEVVDLINDLTVKIARGVDHFALLGLPVGASIEDIHAAYVELARNISAKRLRELGITDNQLLAEGVLAQLLIAFTVLTDRIRRAEYMASLAEGVATPRKVTTTSKRR